MTLALALIGCGVMGRRHIKGMGRLHAVGKKAFDLAAVCDVFPASADAAADIARDLIGVRPQTFNDVSAMFRAVKLDGVIITTTPETHVEIGLQALDAGLHILAEKPITLTVREGMVLVAAARDAGRKLGVAENYRRDPINRLARALLDAGAIGRPFLAVQASSGAGESVIITPWRHLKAKGGITVDMGVHYTDILEYLLGDIESVFGMNAVVDAERIDANGARHPADAEDLSVGVARFTSGALANWMLSMAGRGAGYFKRAIYGTGGSLEIPADRTGKPLQLVQRHDGKDAEIADPLALVPDFHTDPVTAALFGGERLTSYDLTWADIDANLLGIEQADFCDAIVHDREPEVTGAFGVRSLALAFGFLESGMIGRPVSADEMLSGAARAYEASMEG
jgi:predicted dehydrogenase